MKQIYNTAQPPVIYRTNKLNYVWNYLGSTLKTFARVICPFLREINCFNLPIDVTSSELARLGKNSLLKPGATYRVSDYKAVNFINGIVEAENTNPTNLIPNYNSKEVYISDETDTILIKAITENRFDTVAHSEQHPMDVLNYDPYVQELSLYVFLQTGATLPNGNTVTNFNLQWDADTKQVYIQMPAGYPVLFGKDLFIQATFNGVTNWIENFYNVVYPGLNDTNYIGNYNNLPTNPNTIVKLDISPDGYRINLVGLTQADFLLYDADSLYVDSYYQYVDNLNVRYVNYGLVRRRTDTINKISIPLDWRYVKYRRYEIDITGSSYAADLGNTGFYACGAQIFGATNLFPVLGDFSGEYRDYNVVPKEGAFIYNFVIDGDYSENFILYPNRTDTYNPFDNIYSTVKFDRLINANIIGSLNGVNMSVLELVTVSNLIFNTTSLFKTGYIIFSFITSIQNTNFTTQFVFLDMSTNPNAVILENSATVKYFYTDTSGNKFSVRLNTTATGFVIEGF